MKQTVFYRFHNLIPVSISNRLHAIRCSQPCSCMRLAASSWMHTACVQCVF